MPCLRESYTEDNDTEESEEEEEKEAKTTIGDDAALIKLKNMLADRKAAMRDLRKGFVFFMDQEKKDIRKHQAIKRALKLQQKTEDLDAPKKWFEDEQLFRPISEWTLQKNEWQDFDEGVEKV